MKKVLFETEKKFKDTQKVKLQIEADCRNYENQNMKEMEENYSYKMALDKSDAFGSLGTHRHDRDLRLITDFRNEKDDEKKKLVESRNKTHQEYMAMGELQGLINEGEKYKDEIEEMHVRLQHLSIKIKELEDATEYLLEKKEELDDAKKATDEANEELAKQLKAKEEANQKRLIAKLQRDKNPEIKELIIKEEQQQEANEDFSNKLRQEVEKHDQLLDELTQLKENLKLTKVKFEETKANIEVQDIDLKNLSETITQKQTEANQQIKTVEEARKVNAVEMDKNLKFAKANAALRAKLDFIESKYDYSTTAKQLSIEDFKDLITSNLNVN